MDTKERSRQAFDIVAIGDVYVRGHHLTEAQFDQLFTEVVAIRGLAIDGIDWVLFDHVLSVYRTIPLRVHIEALSAGLGIAYRGIQAFYEATIERGIMPPTMLNELRFFKPPQERLRIGALLVELGVIRQSDLQRALGIKMLIRDATGIDPALGQIFRSLCNLPVVQFYQALGLQVGIPFQSLDNSAEAIYDAALRTK